MSAKTLYILSCSLKDYLLKLLTHYVCNKIRAKFTGGCLKQSYIHLSLKSYNKLTYTYGKVVNVYIVYELSASSSHFDDPTPKNCLFGTVTLTKNADIDKYGYSGYGIGFDRKSHFSFTGGGYGQNVLIFGVDMSFSAHTDNKKKDIVLGKGSTQGLEHILTAEIMHSINFTVAKKKFCLSFHYNGANSYLFVNAIEIYKFKAKDSEIVPIPLCLGNILKDWSTNNMKKTGFNEYVYDFSVDYEAIAVDDIKNIHKYLMTKNDIV